MKTQWNFKGFELDLSPLWTDSSALQAPPDWERLSNDVWQSFLLKSHSGEVGFFDWPLPAHSDELSAIEQLADKIKSEYQSAVCIGIGGSYLGPSALQEIFNPVPSEDSFQVQWISNVDTAPLLRAKRLIQTKKSAAVIISKSGGTTETLAAWFHLSHHFTKESVIVITDPEQGELRRLARAEGWNALPVPSNIGGRFSVLTAVGLFPLALQGIPIRKLIEGAYFMRQFLTSLPPQENPAVLYALSKFLCDKAGYSNQYLMPYDSRLKLLADWYVQLWAESLGKKQKKTNESVGPNPVSALGTSDQHSLLQLFKEGPPKRIIGFLSAEDLQSPQIGKPKFSSPDFDFLTKFTFSALNLLASQATQESLIRSQVPTYRFALKNLDAFTLGAFILFQEAACAVAGELYQVNAFDQPGVEEAKRLLKKSML